MNDEHTPDIEDLKSRLKDDIPVEEDVEQMKAGERARGQSESVSEALRNLGQQFAHTVQAAWESDERRRVESEIREGMRQFAQEVDRVFKEAKESPTGQRARQEASELKTTVETGEAGQKVRANVVQGLQWLSVELARLADQFGPQEKEPATGAEEKETEVGSEKTVTTRDETVEKP